MLTTDPADSTQASEPAEPMDRIEPAEPTDKMEPVDPMDRMDPLEPMDRIDPDEPAERDEPSLIPMGSFCRNGYRTYRRFNQARYDAETLVAAFTARLRQTVDLDTVQGDLVGVIDAAFQPAHVSVWLPPRT